MGSAPVFGVQPDFRQRSFLFGHPPKIVWLRVGNCSTKAIEALLRSRAADIEAFLARPARHLRVFQWWALQDLNLRPTDYESNRRMSTASHCVYQSTTYRTGRPIASPKVGRRSMWVATTVATKRCSAPEWAPSVSQHALKLHRRESPTTSPAASLSRQY